MKMYICDDGGPKTFLTQVVSTRWQHKSSKVFHGVFRQNLEKEIRIIIHKCDIYVVIIFCFYATSLTKKIQTLKHICKFTYN